MKSALFFIIALTTLSGCTTTRISKEYPGPFATIRDFEVSEAPNRYQFYFLSEIDGRKIDNVLLATRRANRGNDFSQTTVYFLRRLPARATTLKLEARIAYAAPMEEMQNKATIYTADVTLNFLPESNKTYVVKGTLTADKKEVWLEEVQTGKRVE
jgi:hypothetical protein